MRRSLVFVACSLLLLAGCSRSGGGDENNSSSSSSSSVEVTHNVTYQGLLEEAGVNVYMEGTHRLTLNDGRMVLLTSGDPLVDLDMYIGDRVEVTGSTQPTVEAGGTIMSVEQISRTSSSDSSATSTAFCGGIAGIMCDSGFTCIDDPNDTCDPKNGGADCGGICVAVSSSSIGVSSMTSVPGNSSSSSAAVSSTSASSISASVSSASSALTSDIEAQVIAMAKENFSDPARWTQTYCTSHMDFCIPVHKNWYYRSFGATANAMWRVEFSNEDFETLGSGVITLQILPGSSTQAGGTNGMVKVSGDKAVGYLDWDNNRHFEISSDARLQAAISYMIANISKQTPAAN